MAEYWSFLNRLRHDLGTRYTVAEEHAVDPQQVHILVRRQRSDELLIVHVDARWLALIAQGTTPSLRVEYKHLAVVIRKFFAHPDTLPARTFRWPGTQESREELRRTLNPRRRIRSA